MPQAAGGFSFQESQQENWFPFDLLHSSPQKAGGFWRPLTSAEVDKTGGIFCCHSGLVLENQLLSMVCPWLSLDLAPTGSSEVGPLLFSLSFLRTAQWGPKGGSDQRAGMTSSHTPGVTWDSVPWERRWDRGAQGKSLEASMV